VTHGWKVKTIHYKIWDNKENTINDVLASPLAKRKTRREGVDVRGSVDVGEAGSGGKRKRAFGDDLDNESSQHCHLSTTPLIEEPTAATPLPRHQTKKIKRSNASCWRAGPTRSTTFERNTRSI